MLTGPFSGGGSVSSAAVTVRGSAPGQWVGLDGAIGDFDGDGAADLAVGGSWSICSGPEPGQVGLFPAVSPGESVIDEAFLRLVSGSTQPDAFGISIAPGDLDGDGRLDLVIGAPHDSRARELAGAVTVVFGAGLEASGRRSPTEFGGCVGRLTGGTQAGKVAGDPSPARSIGWIGPPRERRRDPFRERRRRCVGGEIHSVEVAGDASAVRSTR